MAPLLCTYSAAGEVASTTALAPGRRSGGGTDASSNRRRPVPAPSTIRSPSDGAHGRRANFSTSNRSQVRTCATTQGRDDVHRRCVSRELQYYKGSIASTVLTTSGTSVGLCRPREAHRPSRALFSFLNHRGRSSLESALVCEARTPSFVAGTPWLDQGARRADGGAFTYSRLPTFFVSWRTRPSRPRPASFKSASAPARPFSDSGLLKF